jgi:predicted MPP superfamily phosphohydrolase
MIRLLHLSDIHFRKPWCLKPREDRDSTVRQLIIDDAVTFINTTNINFDAILVTGDIAYKALPEEFEAAANWFAELAEAIGLPPSNVFVVPGNHDINRQCADTLAVRANKKIILDEQGERRIETFEAVLRDPSMGASLLEPFKAYNDFARQYGCSIDQTDSFWEHEITFCERYTLRLNGLTSTFFSDSSDVRANLFMGVFQANLPIKRGTVNLAMFHHPYDWLDDGDAIADQLSNNAQITLVGHKHRQRIHFDNGNVIFSAAATNPSRNETDYKPGYNIIDLSIREDNEKAWIDIEGHLRTLQDTPAKFTAKITRDDESSWKYSFQIQRAHNFIQTIDNHITVTEVSPEAPIVPIENESLNTQSVDPTRLTAYRFWNLKESQRRNVVNSLKLLNNEQLKKEVEERFIHIFELVSLNNLQEQFIQLIQTEEGKT